MVISLASNCNLIYDYKTILFRSTNDCILVPEFQLDFLKRSSFEENHPKYIYKNLATLSSKLKVPKSQKQIQIISK